MAKQTTEETLFHWLAALHKELRLTNYYLAQIRGIGAPESELTSVERAQALPHSAVNESDEMSKLRNIIHQQLKEILDIPSEEE